MRIATEVFGEWADQAKTLEWKKAMHWLLRT